MINIFSKWLDKLLANRLPNKINAFNFNIYEGEQEGEYQMQLIGAEDYDPDDDDWACDEIFSSGEDLFVYSATDTEDAQKIAFDLVRLYLKQGRFANKLKRRVAVTIGFVDGDLLAVLPEETEFVRDISQKAEQATCITKEMQDEYMRAETAVINNEPSKALRMVLMGEIKVETFVRILKAYKSVQHVVEELVPPEANDPDHNMWKHLMYKVYKEEANSVLRYLDYFTSFKKTKFMDLSACNNFFDILKWFYSCSNNEPLVYSTWYDDAHRLFVDIMPNTYKGYSVCTVTDSIIREAMTENEWENKVEHLFKRIKQEFICTGTEQPVWLGFGDWQMGEKRPMAFVSQTQHGRRIDYLFQDMDSGKTKTVSQYYLPYEYAELKGK